MRDDDLPQSRAAGFVLSRPGPGATIEYLLLDNRRDGMPGFPKGHQDGDENDLETALRETREETGLTDVDVVPGFREEIRYRVRKGGQLRMKSVVYFRARHRGGRVVLSDEHTGYRWMPLTTALDAITFDSLRDVLHRAALHAKDPALFQLIPPDYASAQMHLMGLPHADAPLVSHLVGGARLARAFAERLASSNVPVHVEAATVGTLLHDVGRALGKHKDHQAAGLRHLRGTRFAPYAFACVSHFTKGASRKDLREAGVEKDVLDEFEVLVDTSTMTWEERCTALADSCMKGITPSPPAERFADLRQRYGPDAEGIIALQERRTGEIRGEIEAAIGRDPLSLVRLG